MALGRFFSLSLLSLLAIAQTSPPSQDWHAAIPRGVELFKHGRYPDAAAAFEEAAALRPDDPVSHLYVGIAWKQQFIPGFIPQNQSNISAIAAHAEQEFQRALELDPRNWPALVLLGQFDLQRNLIGALTCCGLRWGSRLLVWRWRHCFR
jgi:tetratricopeptide (TPR) repeat protein